MALTIREKEHWKERIDRKLDQAIESITAAEDPDFMQKLSERAKSKAEESLGILKWQQIVDEIGDEIRDADLRRQQIYKQMLAIVKGVSLEDARDCPFHPPEVDTAIKRRQGVITKELLKETETGRRILKLQQEKDELLDTVWLATSPNQIKELWATVSKLLKNEPTDLQKEALAISPLDAED